MRITNRRATPTLAPTLARTLALTLAALTTALTGLLAASSLAAAATDPAPVSRSQLLTLDDYETVHPDMRDPLRFVLRSPVFAPRGCEDQGQVVRGTSRIEGSVSPASPRRSVALIDQNVVRFASKAEARALVQRYRGFSKHCVGNVRTDDGEGGDVLLKNRAWFPPRVGDESAGMLIGWFQGRGVDWRRVMAVRVGRTVSVLDVSYVDIRPPKDGVVALGELAVSRLG
jgi:hypothetical protein